MIARWIDDVVSNGQMTSQEEKILISPPRKSKKNNNLTMDLLFLGLLFLGIYPPGPRVLTYRPQILRGVRI